MSFISYFSYILVRPHPLKAAVKYPCIMEQLISELAMKDVKNNTGLIIIATHAEPKEQFKVIIDDVKSNDNLTKAFVDALHVKNTDDNTSYKVFIERNPEIKSQLDDLIILNAMNETILKCKNNSKLSQKLEEMKTARTAYRTAPEAQKIKALRDFNDVLCKSEPTSPAMFKTDNINNEFLSALPKKALEQLLEFIKNNPICPTQTFYKQ